MAIKWEAYDVQDRYELFDAVCLWLEIEPTREVASNVPLIVNSLFRHMKRYFLEMNQQSPTVLEPKGKHWEGHIGGVS